MWEAAAGDFPARDGKREYSMVDQTRKVKFERTLPQSRGTPLSTPGYLEQSPFMNNPTLSSLKADVRNFWIASLSDGPPRPAGGYIAGVRPTKRRSNR